MLYNAPSGPLKALPAPPRAAGSAACCRLRGVLGLVQFEVRVLVLDPPWNARANGAGGSGPAPPLPVETNHWERFLR